LKPTLIWDRHETECQVVDYPYAHISLLEPDEPAYALPDWPKRVAHLTIVVRDYRSKAQADEPKNAQRDRDLINGGLPRPKQFAELPPFIDDTLSRVEGYVVNCGAGVSRSSGLAVALGTFLGHSIKYCFEGRYNPNFLITQCALHSLWFSSRELPWDKLISEARLWDRN